MASDLKMELRWLVQGSERVLQYRQQYMQTQYGMQELTTGGHIQIPVWSEWQDVAEYKEEVQ